MSNVTFLYRSIHRLVGFSPLEFFTVKPPTHSDNRKYKKPQKKKTKNNLKPLFPVIFQLWLEGEANVFPLRFFSSVCLFPFNSLSSFKLTKNEFPAQRKCEHSTEVLKKRKWVELDKGNNLYIFCQKWVTFSGFVLCIVEWRWCVSIGSNVV